MQSLDRHRAATIASLLGRIACTDSAGCCWRPTPPFWAAARSIVIHERPILDRDRRTTAEDTVTPRCRRRGPARGRDGARQEASRLGDHVLSATPRSEGAPGDARTRGSRRSSTSPSRTGRQGIYRRAIEYMLETANRQAKIENGSLDRRPRAGGDRRPGQARAVRGGPVGGGAADPPVRDQGLPPPGRPQGASGRPVVASLIRAGKWGEPRSRPPVRMTDPSEHHFPKTLYRAASAVLRPGAGPDEPLAVLELHDPVLEPDLRWQPASGAPERAAGLRHDRAAGPPAPHHQPEPARSAWPSSIPSEYNSQDRHLHDRPVPAGEDPGGLRPRADVQPRGLGQRDQRAAGDPELRKRYQFWMFFYSTGNPLLASGRGSARRSTTCAPSSTRSGKTRPSTG